MSNQFFAGAAQVSITPADSQFLFGYPHVARYSTGVHDPLLASAVYLSDGRTDLLFIANDIIFIPKELAVRVRDRIEKETSVPAGHIMVTATHTHSGPITVNYLSNENDVVVPKADENYLRRLEEGIFEAAVAARKNAQAAEAGLGIGDATGIGTNRRDVSGPADLSVPVLAIRSAREKKLLSVMLICCMHPTVLHEDSTLVSGDFPGLARIYLQKKLGGDCVVAHHTGPQGNQSPRHVTKANTFAEAKRLGEILGRAVEKALAQVHFSEGLSLDVAREFVELPPRDFPPVEQARQRLAEAAAGLERLRKSGSPAAQVRTAECDWFGAEETLALAQAGADGKLEAVRHACMPAEVQIFKVGPWNFVGWPGEIFIEYALEVKAKRENTFVVALANGELQGYIVTPQAAAENGYEASNALFDPSSGRRLVEAMLSMLERQAK